MYHREVYSEQKKKEKKKGKRGGRERAPWPLHAAAPDPAAPRPHDELLHREFHISKKYRIDPRGNPFLQFSLGEKGAQGWVD